MAIRRKSDARARLVYITVPGVTVARKIGRVLVQERLAACANILPDMESIYWWQGKLQRAHEAVLLLKTRRTLVPRLIHRARELHPYECPCIVTLPIESGFAPFLAWIGKETR